MNTTYSLPPEWHSQSGVMLTWPHIQSDWAPWLADVELNFIAIAKAVTFYEKLLISCFDQQHKLHIETLLQQAEIPAEKVRLFIVPSDDTWARDHGPITVFKNGQLTMLDFKFNAWGDKYSATRDDQITKTLHQLGAFSSAIKLESIPLVLEGGSIEVDGNGSLLTTKNCLLSDTRNNHLSLQELEEQLKNYLGVQQILWLEDGYLAGDDTDSHIDTLARFTDQNTICYMSCPDQSDEHFLPLQKMAEQLRCFKNINGNPYKLVPLPWPRACFSVDGKRLPATYANFLIINNAVLVPTYDDPADQDALHQIKNCFPDREIIGIPCRTLIEQFGSLHCVTMQIPEGVLA